MSCPSSLSLVLLLSVLASLLLAGRKEKRYTCKCRGQACVYERARLYTYESRRISGHTTGAEISFIYPRLPASLLTVYPQHLIHHGCIVRARGHAYHARVRACTRIAIRPGGRWRRYAILFALMNFFGGNSGANRWNANVARPSPWERLSDAAH